MSFAWFNINPGYKNQLMRYSSEGGKLSPTFHSLLGSGIMRTSTPTFSEQLQSKIPREKRNSRSALNSMTITLKTGYRLDMTVSIFSDLLRLDEKILTNQVNVGPRVPNLSQDTDILNVHCDLINESLVDGQDTDILYSFSTSVLRPSYSFTLDPQKVTFSPVNKTNISSIRIYITDGKRKLVNLNGIDTAFSLLLRKLTS